MEVQKIRKKIGIGNEGKIHKIFASLIKQYEAHNQLNALWSYNASGEKRNEITGALLKAKGLQSGWADYQFISLNNNIAEIVFIEFKYGKNKQSLNQEVFATRIINSKCSNIKYFVCYSAEEAINALIESNILLN
jgi:hypothetical protein